MKRLFAIVLAALFLASCAEKPADPFAGLEFSDAATSPTTVEKSPEETSEPDEELEFPYNLEWGGEAAFNSPYYIEDNARTGAEYNEWLLRKEQTYMQELGLEEDFVKYLTVYVFDDGTVKKISGGVFGCSYSGDYYKYTFSFDTITYAAVNIDTNVAGPCSAEITMTVKNPDTGEEKTVTVIGENAEGECGLKYIAYAEEGFYIKKLKCSYYFLGKYAGGDEYERGDETLEEQISRYLNGEEFAWKDPKWDGVI